MLCIKTQTAIIRNTFEFLYHKENDILNFMYSESPFNLSVESPQYLKVENYGISK